MSKTTLLVLVLASVGCRNNPRYCADHYGQDCDYPWDGSQGSDTQSQGCTSNATCTAPTAVCDVTGTMTCVACIAPDQVSACTGTSPTCGDDHACHACSSHDDCASKACLPDGSCGTDANVAYVDPAGTDNTTCSKATPCTKVAKALGTGRAFVKFHATTDEQVSINNQNVTLLADSNAKLTSTTNGIVLEVKGTSQVSIFDLEITGASGAAGYGISMPAGNMAALTLRRAKLTNNAGGGFLASGGALSIARSTISGNGGGGISISNATFVLVNNMFFSNGSGTSAVGGVSITTTQNATNRLEFNSFNKNITQDGLAPAIQCFAGTFTARNNAMSGNGTLTNMNQTGGTCTHAYSIATPGTLPPGTGNLAVDPLFVNTTTGDLHLQAGSLAIDAADPAADLTGLASVDFDGDIRPQGAHADIGADEVQ